MIPTIIQLTCHYGPVVARGSVDYETRTFLGSISYELDGYGNLDEFCRGVLNQFLWHGQRPQVITYRYSGQIFTAYLAANWAFTLFVRDASAA